MKSELEIFKERELSALKLQMAATQRRELDAMRKELQVGVTKDEMYTRESLGVCGELMTSGGGSATSVLFFCCTSNVDVLLQLEVLLRGERLLSLLRMYVCITHCKPSHIH